MTEENKPEQTKTLADVGISKPIRLTLVCPYCRFRMLQVHGEFKVIKILECPSCNRSCAFRHTEEGVVCVFDKSVVDKRE